MATIPRHLLTRTATHMRKVRTADGQGGFANVWTAQTPATFVCRLWPAKASERQLAQQGQEQITHGLVYLSSTVLRRGDRATIDSVDYEVRSVLPPSVTAHHGKALVEELQAGT